MGWLLLLTAAWFAKCALAEESVFGKISFKDGIALEVPRHWHYNDKAIRDHLNTAAEAVGRAAGAPVFQGNNEILLSGGAKTSGSVVGATVRLSVRKAQSPSQLELREGSKISHSELRAGLRPAQEEVERYLRTVESVRGVKALDVSIETNGSIWCFYMDFEVGYENDIRLQQTWTCPFGTRSVKLSTSYRKSDTALFKPVIQHVWKSLRVD